MKYFLITFLLITNSLFSYADSIIIDELFSKAIENVENISSDSFDVLVQQGFELLKAEDDLLTWLINHQKIGKLFYNKKNHRKALFYYNRALEKKWRPHANKEELGKIATITGWIGNVYRKGLNAYEPAKEYYEKYKVLSRDSLRKPDVYIARYVYNPLGAIYHGLKDEQKAIHYYTQSLAIAKAEKDWRLFAQATNNLGGFFIDIGKEEKALEIYNQALLRIDSLSNKGKVMLLNEIGLCYYYFQDYKQATRYTEAANKIALKHTNDFDQEDLLSFRYDYCYNLGRIKKGEQYFKASEQYYLEALNILQSNAGEGSSRELVTMHNNLGVLYLAQQDFSTAKEYFNKSVQLLSPRLGSFQDPFLIPQKYLFGESQLNYAYEQLGNTFLESYRQGSVIRDLEKGIRYFELSDQVGELQLQHFSSENSDLGALSRQRELKEKLQASLFELWTQTKSQESLEKMLYYSDKSRAVLLSEAQSKKKEMLEWNEKNRVDYYELKGEHKSLSSKIFKLEKQLGTQISEELSSLKINLIELEDEIAALESPILKKKRQEGIWSKEFLAKIRKAIDADQAFVQYFFGEDHLYSYLVTKDSLHVTRTSISKDWTNEIQAFKSKLSDYNEPLNSIQEEASNLFEILIQPVLNNIPEGINRLVISKDRSLNLIPFEVLGINNPSTNTFEYLLEDYAISYTSSAQVFVFQQSTTSKRAEYKFLGFAPSYRPEKIIKKDTLENKLIAMLVRSGQYNLEGAVDEVRIVAEALNGDSRFGEEASEFNFKEIAKDYQILLLSMHGNVNEDNPNFSELLFTPKSADSEIDDNLLHPIEISDLKLNADLVVLSACETGVGKIYPGEGVFSFSRAFTKAGVPSTLMTLWKAHDQSTSDLITTFFQQLEKGATKDVALQVAKLNYLKENKYKHSSLHPFLWAGLQICGNSDALDIDSYFSSTKIISLLGIVLFIFVVIIFRKNS